MRIINNKIKELISKKYFFNIVYGCFIICFSVFVVLEAIVIPKGEQKVPHNESFINDLDESSVIIEENKYVDNNIQITISYDRYCDSNIYIADVKLSNYKYFRTAFSKDIFGKNIERETSVTAKENNAIFAVNGDYYGFRDFGFVVRNGVVYRKNARPTGRDDIMIFYTDGTVKFAHERTTTMESEIIQSKKEGKDIYQMLTFGPVLIDNKDNESTSENEDTIVNPRTAFGIYSPLHYVFVCVDGRK